MSAFIRKNLTFSIFKHASNKNVYLCISPVSVSISLSPHFFSTQTLHLNPNPNVYDILVHKHNFPCEFASRVTSQLSRIKNPERVDSMLSFLKSSGFSIAHLQKVIKYRPNYLCYNLERIIKPKIKSFQDEGFSSADIVKIVSSSPSILSLSLKNNIIPSFSYLKGLMGSNAALIRLVRNSPRVLNSNFKKTLVPNLEFLKRCGVSVDRIRVVINGGHVSAFICKPEIIKASVEKTKEMGLTVSSKAFIYGILTIVLTSNGGWEVRLQAFRDMGFSDIDTLSMFRKEPSVFLSSIAKAKKITQLLVATGKFDISSIVHCPAAFKYSIKMRYEPRLRILGVLDRKNLIENWPPLSTLCILSAAQFFKLFISPYLDHLSDVYIPKVEMKYRVFG